MQSLASARKELYTRQREMRFFKRKGGMHIHSSERETTIIEAAKKFSSATLHEAAGKRGALPSVLKPLRASMQVAGRAFPVQSPPGDNLWLHRAIAAAQPGDVLVVNTHGAGEYGYWGEIMTYAALQRQLAGLVLDGGIRDSQLLIELGFPVFTRGICIQGTSKDPNGAGSLYHPIHMGDVLVHPGDLVLGDADGIVVLPWDTIEQVLEQAQQRETAEASVIERLTHGETTLDIYHLSS